MSEEGAPTIELFSSNRVPAGSAAAFVCRAVALRAGAYAPGIHESVFNSLRDSYFGANIDGVFRWFNKYSSDLFSLGYKLRARRVPLTTPEVTGWIARGEGFRAAVLGIDGSIFHSGVDSNTAHAVGVTVGGPGVPSPSTGGGSEKDSASNGLVIADPWPNVDHHRHADGKLEAAHRGRKYASLIVFWSGYS